MEYPLRGVFHGEPAQPTPSQKEGIMPNITTEHSKSFTHHALTRSKGSAEVVPAREFLAELAAKLGA